MATTVTAAAITPKTDREACAIARGPSGRRRFRSLPWSKAVTA